jgi:hypothetical protein
LCKLELPLFGVCIPEPHGTTCFSVQRYVLAGRLRINVDAVFFLDTGIAGVGVVIVRDGRGQVVTCKPPIQSTVFDPDFYAIRASSSLQLVEVVAVQCDGHVATYSLHS